MRGVFAALILLASAASAHDADVIYASIRSDEAGGLHEILTLTGDTLALLAPIDADGDRELTQSDLDARTAALAAGVWDQAPLTAGGVRCTRGGETATLRQGYVELTASFACGPGELRQDFRILSVIPTNYRVVVGSQIDGERGKAFAQGTFTALTIARPPPPRSPGGRFEAAVREGLMRAGSLDGGPFLLLVFFAAASRKRAALAGFGVLIGMSAGSFALVSEPGPSVMLVIACLGLAAGGQVRALEVAMTALGAVALGLRGGGGDAATITGLIAGSATVVLLSAGLGSLLRRIFAGRPAAAARVAIAGVAVVGLGIRLAARLLS